MYNHDEFFKRLSYSKFRSSFKLTNKDFEYIDKKGLEVIKSHAYDFVKQKLALAYPKNDGRQTAMKGHPVFIAQHACGCCCRGCLEKWHHISKGRELTKDEIDYIVDILMEWINREIRKRNIKTEN